MWHSNSDLKSYQRNSFEYFELKHYLCFFNMPFSGMWYSILEFLNVVGVVTNSFLVAFTSQYGRNWEGDSTHTSVSQEVYNSTTNVTFLLQTITEQVPSRNRLWLIIGFEVKYFYINGLIILILIFYTFSCDYNLFKDVNK